MTRKSQNRVLRVHAASVVGNPNVTAFRRDGNLDVGRCRIDGILYKLFYY